MDLLYNLIFFYSYEIIISALLVCWLQCLGMCLWATTWEECNLPT